MAQVGEFPGIHQLHRRTVRGPINPMDKSTIISIYPKEIVEIKYTIQPGKFVVPPGTLDKPGILTVGPSSWWRDIDEDQPLLEIPVSSIQIAESIIKDYTNGLLGCNMADARPGLIYVVGEHSQADILKNYKPELEKAELYQRNWFAALVKLGDALWARSQGNPMAISEDMRFAAIQLALNDKPWIKDFQAMEMVRCFACGSLKNPQYPVCPSCRAVDMAHPNAKNIKFAQ